MSLTQALSTALTGLRASQAGLTLVAGNVANAETPGYVRKTVNQVTTYAGEFSSGARVIGVNRELDKYLSRQLRTEYSGQGFAGTRASFLSRLQSLYGVPGSASTLESAFGNFSSALQALSTSSDSQSARIGVVNAAQTLAQQLNLTTQGIQALRTDAEDGIASAVNKVNDALAQIAAINNKLERSQINDASTASLLDQRDRYLDEVSQLMDIRTATDELGKVTVFTNSGVQLVGAEAATLSFDAKGLLTPSSTWDSNPALRGVGTLTVTFPRGGTLDLVDSKALRSGAIAAYLELRDNTLVQAQAQIDQLAAVMASAMSDRTTAGTAATSGAQTGFDVDLAGLAAGNTINLTYTNASGTHKVTIMRVDDPSVLPLDNNATLDPSDQVIGVNFSGGMASVVSQINAALAGSGVTASNPSGQTLRILDDGAVGTSDVVGMSTTITQSSFINGGPELPLFTDGGVLYTGAITQSGVQMTGLAGRITINTQLLGDPSKLLNYSATTLTGDTTRPDFLYDQLQSGTFYFSPETGLGRSNAPYKGTMMNFTQQVMAMQGEASSSASQLAEGQDVVVNTLQEKFNTASGVNIDEEMAHLLALQNAYAANARVMSVVKDMFQALLNA